MREESDEFKAVQKLLSEMKKKHLSHAKETQTRAGGSGDDSSGLEYRIQ